jgi:hypothetical protein
MKINKLLLGFVSLLAIALSGCSDDDDFSRATIEGNQVYFSNELSTSLTTPKSTSTVNIPVNRIKTAEAITVPLTVTKPSSSIYNIPSSVSFAAGDSVAYIPVTYNPDDVTYGKYEDITITIGDSTYTTPYGYSTITVSAGAEEWGAWQNYNSVGTANFEYSQFWSGVDADLPFQVRQSVIDPNKYQFRIQKCMAGIDFVMNYDEASGHVTFDNTFTGYNHATYGKVYVCEYNYYVENVQGKKLDESQRVYGSFDKVNGIITLPVVYYVSDGVFGNGNEYIYLNGFNRADYSVDVVYTGKLINAKNVPSILANVTLGADCTSANVALVPGKEAALTEAVIDSIANGTYAGVQEVDKSGQVSFDASQLEDGDYTIVAVSFGGGQAQNYATAAVSYSTGGSKTIKWKVVASGVYTFGAKTLSDGASSIFDNGSTAEATLYQDPDNPKSYKISPWTEKADLLFTVDDNGAIHFNVDTGEKYSDGSAIMFTDIDAYSEGKYASYVGTYDADTKTFSFTGAYNVPGQGGFGYVTDTFKESASAAKSMKVAAKRHHKKATLVLRKYPTKEVKPVFMLH